MHVGRITDAGLVRLTATLLVVLAGAMDRPSTYAGEPDRRDDTAPDIAVIAPDESARSERRVTASLQQDPALQVAPAPPGNGFPEGGGVFGVGDVISGDLASFSETDTYEFDTSFSGQWVFLNRTNSTSPNDLSWQLEDVWGRVIVSSLTAMNDMGPVPLIGGTYRIAIHSDVATPVTYEFHLSDATPQQGGFMIGDVVSSSIPATNPGQSDVYSFSARAGDRVFVNAISSSNSGGLNWMLLDDYGREIFARTTSLADQGPLFLMSGDYTLTILPEGDNTGAYSFQLIEVTDDSSGLTIGDTISGNVSIPGQSDHYAFTGSAGQRIFLNVLSTSNSSGLNFIITDAQDRPVLSQTNSLVDNGPITLPGGDYTLTILGEGDATGTYSVQIVNVIDDSATISIGDVVMGNITTGQKDVYTFTAGVSLIVLLDQQATSNLGGLNWILNDAHGRDIVTRTTSLADQPAIALVGGAYTATIIGEGDATGTYTISIVDQGTSSFTPTGTAINIGDTVTNMISTPGGNVSYTFVATAGQRIYVDLLANSSSLEWELFDPAGRRVFLKPATSSDAADAGPMNLAAGNHQLTLRATTGPATPSYNFKLWNVTDTTTAASFDSVNSGDFIDEVGAVHSFTFTATRGQRVFFERVTAATRLEWTLLDSAGRAVFGLTDADSINTDQGPFDLVAGNYTLVLDPEFGYQPTYDFAIRNVSDTSMPVSLDTVQTGAFTGAIGATQSFTFTVSDGQEFYFDRITNTSLLKWTLRDPVGRALTGFNLLDADSNLTGDFGPITLAAGTYTLMLDPDFSGQPAYDFEIVSVMDTSTPLAFDTGAMDMIDHPGATVSYAFTAIEGQRIHFDLISGANPLDWSLIDPVGLAVFNLADAVNTDDDQGPFNLAAGTYTLVFNPTFSDTASFNFTAFDIVADFAIELLDSDPRVLFLSQSPRNLAVTWTVENAGGGAMISSGWTDWLVLSIDDILGNGDDIFLGNFANAAGLAGHADYTRTENVTVSDALDGEFHIFVIVDVNGDVAETFGETNNTAVLELAVVPDPDLDLDTISRVDTFPVSFVTGPGELFIDIPLVGQIVLDEVRFVLVDALRMNIVSTSGGGSQTTAVVSLLNGTTELLEVDTASPSTTAASGASFASRFSRMLTAETVAALPTNIADGVRMRFIQPHSTRTTISSIHADQTLHVHFAGCEFHPCGPHMERLFDRLPQIVFNGAGTSPWQVNLFTEAVAGDDLRLVDGPLFAASVSSAFVLASATSEAQLILDNGMFVTLDDWKGPSDLSNPQVNLSNSHSLALNGDQLDGRMVTGFQWRVHVSGGIGPVATFTPTDPLVLSFLYGQDQCSSAIPVAPIEVDPPHNSEFAAGTQVTLTGRALVADATRPVSIVLINNQPADVVDVSGRFFKTVTVNEGDNAYVIKVVEPLCGETQVLRRLRGVTPDDVDFTDFSEVTAQLDDEYVNTTFNQAANTLIVQARPRNIGDTPIDGPLLMGIGSQLDPSITPLDADGFTPDGRPFYGMLDAGGSLDPGQAGPLRTLLFRNPDHVAVDFEVTWYARGNRAPYFITVPPVTGIASTSYSYHAMAADPDGHTVTFSLAAAPMGMSIDSQSGVVQWMPVMSDLGVHDVVVAAEDDRGGRAEQRFALYVVGAQANRVPVFTSAPVTHAAIGAAYSYDANAFDPDGNTLVFSLTDSPMGMSFDPGSGLIDWDFAEPGNHDVTIEVSDGVGAPAVQTFVLTVGDVPANPSAPLITTSPFATAVVDVLYIYQPVAADPDGDDLDFTLDAGPMNATFNTDTGLFQWTPDMTQVGANTVAFTISDGRGGFAQQSFSVNVVTESPNLPPMFETVPGGFATVGQLYQYNASAVDPESQQITFAKTFGPMDIMVDPMTGMVTWTPQSGDVGLNTVALQASDTKTAAGSQIFQISVRDGNADPQLQSTPVLTVVAGETYQYDANADDVDGDLVQYALNTAPPGMTIDSITGLVSWLPGNGDVGVNPIVLTAADCCGGVATQPFDVTVEADANPPEISVEFSQSPAPLNEPVEIFVLASDNIGLTSVTLTVECEPGQVQTLPLDNFRRASYQLNDPDLCTFVGTAVDRAGTVSMDTRPLVFGDPGALDPFPPIVQIISPAPEDVITGPTDIVATISDATTRSEPGSDLSWTVQIARTGTNDFTVIASGSGAVTNGVIAMFNPTMLPNDNYRVQILGDDGLQSGGIEFQYGVGGDFKLGNFAITFTDLTIPLGGIPMVISRVYDSLDTSVGDFGAGWNLGLPGKVTDSATESTSGNPFIDSLANQPYNNKTRVYVTRADGRRVGFTFDPEPLPFPQAFQSRPRFKPDSGVADKLEAVSPTGSTTVWNFGTGYLEFVIPYNPRTFKLTTPEGVTYTIDEIDGLQLIEDLNGNTITVTPGGLVSSTGVSLDFIRDVQGRITEIIFPQAMPKTTNPHDNPFRAGGSGSQAIHADQGGQASLRYDYGPNGSLSSFTDPGENVTDYYYEDLGFPNYLTRIEDPLDRPVIRNVYGTDGRLIAQCGVDGDPVTLENCFSISQDLVANVQTIINPRGYRTDLFLDEDGYVTIERRYLENGIDFVDKVTIHDDRKNPLSVTDAGGTTLFEYDEGGGLLARTDPDGTVSTFSRNSCGLIASTTDATGNVTTYTYDEQCNLRFMSDALGQTIELQYNPDGDVTDFFDASDGHWQFSYDQYGNPETTTDPLGNVEEYHFNETGQILWQVDRNGRRIDYTYHENHHLATATWDTVPPTVFTYNRNDAGFLTSVVSTQASVTVDYWETGLIKSVDNLGTPGVPNVVITYGYYDGATLKPGYDGNGNITHVMDSLGGMTEYVYDALDRLTAVRQYAAPQPGPRPGPMVDEKFVDAVFDANGLLSQVRRFWDLAGTQGVVHTTYEYQCPGCVGRLGAIRHRKAGDNSVVHDLTFDLDPFGFVTGLADAEGMHNYLYDGEGRLISADHPGGGVQPDEFYNYDPAGNRTSSHRSADYTYSYMLSLGGSQLRQDDQYDYEYDNVGNLILQTDRATGDYIEFEYDHLDRLTRIARFDDAGTPLGYSQWTYDPLGRRIRVDDSGAISCYVYETENPILKLSDTGTILGRRLYGLTIDDLLAEDAGGQTRWHLNDGVGSTRDMALDNASVANHYVYDSFGAILDETDPGSGNEITFTARESIPDDETMFFRARLYDPRLGRFTQEDIYSPFQYEYAYDNPLYYYDPLGLQAVIEYRPILAGAAYFVYIGCEGAKVVYVGMTGSWERRVRGHAGRSFRICKILGTDTKNDAKAFEQAFTDAHGGPKSAGGKVLQNKIRSIALNNPLSNRAKAALARLGGGPAAAAAAAALCLVCP